MNVKWYYRQSEVPDSVYQHLVQDRNNENGESPFFKCVFDMRASTHTNTHPVTKYTHTWCGKVGIHEPKFE